MKGRIEKIRKALTEGKLYQATDDDLVIIGLRIIELMEEKHGRGDAKPGTRKRKSGRRKPGLPDTVVGGPEDAA